MDTHFAEDLQWHAGPSSPGGVDLYRLGPMICDPVLLLREAADCETRFSKTWPWPTKPSYFEVSRGRRETSFKKMY